MRMGSLSDFGSYTKCSINYLYVMGTSHVSAFHFYSFYLLCHPRDYLVSCTTRIAPHGPLISILPEFEYGSLMSANDNGLSTSRMLENHNL